MKLKIETRKVIQEQDWSNFVSSVYGRPYCLQQQNGCMDRGIVYLEVPSNYDEDDFIAEDISDNPKENEMCVKFEKWLQRDPKQNLENQKYDFQLNLWWQRHFYPILESVADDLHKKGLLEAGEYSIIIDW